MAHGKNIMVTRHYIQAHSPFTPSDSDGCLLAVCDGASETAIREEIASILEAAIAVSQLLIQEQAENASALWGLAYLVRIAQGLNESLQ